MYIAVYTHAMCACILCSLEESIQDPMVFSLLEVVSLLCAAQSVPSEAWEFILCALVTITHVCQPCVCVCVCVCDMYMYLCKLTYMYM